MAEEGLLCVILTPDPARVQTCCPGKSKVDVCASHLACAVDHHEGPPAGGALLEEAGRAGRGCRALHSMQHMLPLLWLTQTW